ncbi:DUF881 domain-containing protein [Myceligenerans crystallogenes]|uniref:DUF881 domain-containing protein n=1 Tax=Myceligenerans crystallogenes TaxID=316335 RepID=A0ABN2N775_9MICO
MTDAREKKHEEHQEHGEREELPDGGEVAGAGGEAQEDDAVVGHDPGHDDADDDADADRTTGVDTDDRDGVPGTEPGESGEALEAAAAPAPAPARPDIGGRSRLWNLFKPAGRRAEYITAALCVAFGFALAVQVAQSTGEQLASLRQDELVRLLDEVTQRGDQLEDEVANLTQARDDLRSADGRDRAARELAEQRAEYEGILSGRLPAQGPGVVVEIAAQPGTVSAADMFNTLEELRNAGVEAQEINNVRIVTSSHFTETVDGHIMLDGNLLNVPYVWTAIGDPDTVGPALEIPGGALPTLRDHEATAEVTRQDNVAVDATRAPQDPEHATTGSG